MMAPYYIIGSVIDKASASSVTKTNTVCHQWENIEFHHTGGGGGGGGGGRLVIKLN